MRSFNRLSLVTLIAVYLLILVGSIVRITGAGMGCPDWPKCFGSWVPPTSVTELPPDYKEHYAEGRQKKNRRFAKYLSALGLNEVADKILSDQNVLVETEFNATRTWTEYINRLVGVVIGLLIVSLSVLSIRFWKKYRELTIASVITLIMVIFQGWIGSVVVSTNLTPWTITVHMLLALLIVFLLVFIVVRGRAFSDIDMSVTTVSVLIASMVTLLIQILLGTQVREALDALAGTTRNTWIANLGVDFVIHRSFSWIVLILHVILVMKLIKSQHSKILPVSLILLILGTVLTGTGMAYLGVPPVLQPIHLLLATIAFGVQASLLLRINKTKKALVTT